MRKRIILLCLVLAGLGALALYKEHTGWFVLVLFCSFCVIFYEVRGRRLRYENVLAVYQELCKKLRNTRERGAVLKELHKYLALHGAYVRVCSPQGLHRNESYSQLAVLVKKFEHGKIDIETLLKDIKRPICLRNGKDGRLKDINV